MNKTVVGSDLDVSMNINKCTSSITEVIKIRRLPDAS